MKRMTGCCLLIYQDEFPWLHIRILLFPVVLPMNSSHYYDFYQSFSMFWVSQKQNVTIIVNRHNLSTPGISLTPPPGLSISWGLGFHFISLFLPVWYLTYPPVAHTGPLKRGFSRQTRSKIGFRNGPQGAWYLTYHLTKCDTRPGVDRLCRFTT